MRLPGFKRLNKSDFSEEYKDLIETLSVSLNVGIETLHTALNKQLTFRDNIKSTVKEIEVNVNSSGIPKVQTIFNVDIAGQIDGLWVIRSENLTSPTVYPSSGVHISYTQSNNLITVNHVAGLPSDNRFKLKVLIIGA